MPSGAAGLSAVKALPLALTPASPGERPGGVGGRDLEVFAAKVGCSKLPSLMAQPAEIVTSSMNAVLSAVAGAMPSNSTVYAPAGS